MEDLKKIQEFFSKPLEEATFKVGDKVTYLGHPGIITAVRKTSLGDTTYSVAYNKGFGRTKASDIYNKGGEIKLIDFLYADDVYIANIEIPKNNIQIKGQGKTEEEAFEDLKQNYENYKKTDFTNLTTEDQFRREQGLEKTLLERVFNRIKNDQSRTKR